MTDWPNFPPGFEARLCLDDPFIAAQAAGREGAPDGLLLWQDQADRLDAALLLRPIDPLGPSLTLAYTGMLGLIDGLAAVAPPETPVTYAWPDRLLVNEACVGGIRLAWGPPVEREGVQDAPDWVVLGIGVALSGAVSPDDPGHDLAYTDLAEEGAGNITAAMLLESFAHHFLHWLDRWQEEGLAGLSRALEENRADKTLNIEAQDLGAALESPSWTRRRQAEPRG